MLSVVAGLFALGIQAGCGGSSYGGSSGVRHLSAAPGQTGVPATAGNAAIEDLTFAPKELRVSAETTVAWASEDSVGHAMTSTDGSGTDASVSDLLGSGTLGEGQTFSSTFANAGQLRLRVHHPPLHAVDAGHLIVE